MARVVRMPNAVAANITGSSVDGKSGTGLASVFKSQGLSQLQAPVHYVTISQDAAGLHFKAECNARAKHWSQTTAAAVPPERMCKNCVEARVRQAAVQPITR